MRKVEAKMLSALESGRAIVMDDTAVTENGTVFLFGNRITYRNESGKLVADLETFSRWPTATTKSRLKALGFTF